MGKGILDLDTKSWVFGLTLEDSERIALAQEAHKWPDLFWGELRAMDAERRTQEAEALADKIRLQEEARRIVARDSSRAAFPGFADLSLREALAVPRAERPALIEGLQKQGHKATLVAQYKTGKTTLVGNVARALADGRPLFERFHVPELAGHVAIFDYELTEDDALDQYRQLNIHRDDRVHIESLRGTGFTLADDTHAEKTVNYLKSRSVAYWVLDPFGRAMRGFGSENSNDDVRGFLMRLDEIVAEAGVLGVLLPVHTGRALVEQGGERARGATVLDDDPDVRWLLTRTDEQRFFRAEGRSSISVPEIALEFDPASLGLSATDTSRRDLAGQRHRPTVAAFVESHPGATTSEVKASVSGKDNAIDAALKSLIAEGVVEAVRVGRATRHYSAGTVPGGANA